MNPITVSLEEHRELQERYDALARHAMDLDIKLAAQTPDSPSSCEERVISGIRERRERGRRKYGTTMDRPDLTTNQWIQHAQEEAMDLAIYLERLKTHVDPQMLSLIARAWEPPFHYDEEGWFIVDANFNRICDMRGWGYLTGQGSMALGLSPCTAAEITDALGRLLTAQLNQAMLPHSKDSDL